jgi:hypothetical protein
MLKETNDACDHGLQSQLIQYSRKTEDSLMVEATTLSPVDSENIGLCHQNNY